MRRDPIGYIWLAGLGLAVLLTVFGPSLLGFDPILALRRAVAGLGVTLHALGDPALRMIRGFAIAAYVVFIVLCVLARRRRLPSMGMAVLVTILFVLLAGAPGNWDVRLHDAHWPAALLLSLVAALVMTRRLRG